MRTNLFIATALILLTAACGSGGPGGLDTACTLIGSSAGLNVDIAAGAASDPTSGVVTACWDDDDCRSVPLTLFDAQGPPATGCSGDVCSAEVGKPTGGRRGFVDLPGLPTKPVKVTIQLGSPPVLDKTIEVTPAATYPNGPNCGAGGPQASLRVDANGAVSAG